MFFQNRFCPLVHVLAMLVGVGLVPIRALAWGPHTEIAQAALDAIGSEDALVRQLGPDAARLAQYVWMADQRQQLIVRADEVFYTDDFLLFPAAPQHFQHICPEVEQTYSPYFRRALQALRTESPRNAARWIGSLLHFTTDTGSPPHAAGFLGPAHSKMENWVGAKLIHIPGYQPQLLGNDDVSAEAGFQRRMEGLIVYSKERAQRCRPDVDADRRDAVEPVVLESALETARVTADLLHTLGVLGCQKSAGSTLMGKVLGPKINHPSLSRLPAKVVLLGTLFSTLTEADGSFAFHGLPAGEYRVVVHAPGRATEPAVVKLTADSSATLPPVNLAADATSNLVRNPTLTLRWISPERFDDWSLRKPPGKLAAATPMRDWEGEWIPLQKGVAYRLTARWKGDGSDVSGSQVFVRTKAKPDFNSLPAESAPVTLETREIRVEGSPKAVWAQVCIRSAKSPDAVLELVEFRELH